MSGAFQATVGVCRKSPFQCERTRRHVLAGGAFSTESQILVDDQFSDREAVMYHCQIQLFPGVADACLLVGCLAGTNALGKMGEVPVVAEDS